MTYYTPIIFYTPTECMLELLKKLWGIGVIIVNKNIQIVRFSYFLCIKLFFCKILPGKPYFLLYFPFVFSILQIISQFRQGIVTFSVKKKLFSLKNKKKNSFFSLCGTSDLYLLEYFHLNMHRCLLIHVSRNLNFALLNNLLIMMNKFKKYRMQLIVFAFFCKIPNNKKTSRWLIGFLCFICLGDVSASVPKKKFEL